MNINIQPKDGGFTVNLDTPHGKFAMVFGKDSKGVGTWCRPDDYQPPTRPNHEPCVHLGDLRGTVKCKSCKGNVNVKVFECEVHRTCTMSKKLEDTMMCPCEEYEVAHGA